MKTNLKVIALILVIVSSAIYVGCHDELEENGENTAKNLDNFEGEICNGKQILSFNSLADLQQEHLTLYQQYMSNDEEDQTLIDYENSHSFYSLRKKAEDIADGTIPEEPGFDESNFTFDPILETLLNQDGMIIIGERLYRWDSGCIIHNIPFSCANYENLLAFHQAAQSGSTDSMYDIFINNDMKNINVCDDKYFDFEATSENGGRVEAGEPKLKNKNHCGYEVALNAKLVDCNDAAFTYRVSPQTIQPAGTNPFDLYYVKATLGNADDIEISTDLGSWGSFSLGPDGEYGYLVPFNSNDFYIRIPTTNNATPSLIVDITIHSVIGVFTGNSCAATYTTSINNQCPFTIEKTKNIVNGEIAQWTFSINGTANCTLPGGKVKWVFGDGTVIEDGAYTETHTYSVPCEMQYITVTATVDGWVCNTEDKLFTTTIPVGNPCTRSNYKFTTNTDHEINGKKVKLKAKIKRRNWSNKTVFTQVFKCKTNGPKTINSVGSIYKSSGNNENCIPIDISSVVGPQTTNGIKRNRQKVKVSTHFFINALDTYEVNFTHPNAPSTFVLTSGLTCSQ